MLRGSPLLETLFINLSSDYLDETRDHPPVSLPHLRSIEFDVHEVGYGLVTYLQFPQNVAVGFRPIWMSDLRGHIFPLVMDTMQHVLTRIDICCITLTIGSNHRDRWGLLVCFEGLQGSLEIAGFDGNTHAQLLDVPFSPKGVLFSYSPRIEDVRELHTVGCFFDEGPELDHASAAMPNLASISFNCGGSHMFGPLTPTDPSSLPFPHLERIMVFGQDSGLREMEKARRDFGVPLKTVGIGRGPRGSKCGHPEDYYSAGRVRV